MKGIYICMTIIAVLSWNETFAQHGSAKDLTGKWQGIDERNDTGSIEFTDGSHLIFTNGGRRSPPLAYTIDATKDPMWLDMIFQRNGRQTILKGLLQFIDKNTLRFQIFPDGRRPDQFTTGDPMSTSITLKRKSVAH